MLHEIIIWGTVLLIIVLQIKIYLETRKKIKSYESIMKNPERFKTYKVYISEKEIETIDSQHILDNINHYSKNPNKKSLDEINSFQQESDSRIFQADFTFDDLENSRKSYNLEFDFLDEDDIK